MIDWPEQLLEDLGRRRAIVVIGSGVSRHSVGLAGSRPPTWKMFLNDAAEDCQREVPGHVHRAIEEGDLLHACEWLKKRYDENWISYLRRKFQHPRFNYGDIHQNILRLDTRILFSLNFDDIYERCAQEITQGTHITKNYYDTDVSEFLRGQGRYIVKLHGSLNSPDKLIFTQRDYAVARNSYSAFYAAFDAALLSHTLIFIGVGYSDPDVSLLLENQNFSFPAARPHYFLAPMGHHEDLKESLRQNRNLKVLEYDRVDDEHSGLISEIEMLSEEVDAVRREIKENLNW